jgi:hypothetical protein
MYDFRCTIFDLRGSKTTAKQAEKKVNENYDTGIGFS